MSGFFDFFRSGGTAGTPQNAGPGQGQPAPAAPNSGAAPATPGAQPPTTPEVTPTSQLDNYNTLWQTATTADGKPAPLPVDPLTQPVFQLDPAKVAATANQMDFTAGIQPELITKALGGDAQALMDLLNTTARNVASAVTINSGNMVNQGLLANNQRVKETLPQHIRNTQLMDMTDDNPALSHPAVQPLVTALKQMAFQKNPNASPQDVHKQITNYLTGLSTAITESSPQAVQTRQVAAKKETDWEVFLAP
jgi:hypothetical protein